MIDTLKTSGTTPTGKVPAKTLHLFPVFLQLMPLYQYLRDAHTKNTSLFVPALEGMKKNLEREYEKEYDAPLHYTMQGCRSIYIFSYFLLDKISQVPSKLEDIK